MPHGAQQSTGWPLKQLRHGLLRLTPARFQVPIRYWYHRLRNDLEPELLALRELLPSRRTAIDVGANWGCYTYRLSHLCDAVEAFEPIPACVSLLTALARPNVTVHAVALSSSPGQRDLYVPRRQAEADYGYASLRPPPVCAETLRVDVRTLDEYGVRNVSFLKVDVEGHELEVLKGGRETIRRERPLMLVELEQRHLNMPIAKAFEEVTRYGYRGQFLLRGELMPLGRFSPDIYQTLDDEGLPVRPYVNNFLFVPE